MPPSQTTCFGRARKFAKFEQINNLGPESGTVVVDLVRGTSSSVAPDPGGMCWAYCCLWIKRMKIDRTYMVKDLPTFEATLLQKDMAGRFGTSDTSNALILAFGKHFTDYGLLSNILHGSTAVQGYLDAMAKNAHFVMFTLNGTGWAHAVTAKLDRSKTGGWLNLSYPCAMFDPNVGQGMYNNHADMAADLSALFAAYPTLTVRAQTLLYASIN